ncbi:MAG: M48 family metalloprotease [Planctomycetes bacterium]|nr:M48 family metalloprotease [Planctomycetota bacterium]
MSAHALHKLRNLFHSALLIVGMALIVSACAWTLWGAEGIVWGLTGTTLAMVLSPAMPPVLVLSLYRARPVSHTEFPELYVALAELSRRADLSAPPRLYYVPSAMLNAFAVGNRNAAAIAVTDGMLRNLTFRELVGVLAHEVSHIANNDLWVMNLADAMSRVTALMSYLGIFLLAVNLPLIAADGGVVPWVLVLLLIVAPTLMDLLQLALSRAREFDADLDAVRLTGETEWLASALAELESWQGRFWESVLFPGRRVPDPSLLRTHPPTEERIRRLMGLRGEISSPPLLRPAARVVVVPATIMPVARPPRYRWPGI